MLVRAEDTKGFILKTNGKRSGGRLGPGASEASRLLSIRVLSHCIHFSFFSSSHCEPRRKVLPSGGGRDFGLSWMGFRIILKQFVLIYCFFIFPRLLISFVNRARVSSSINAC